MPERITCLPKEIINNKLAWPRPEALDCVARTLTRISPSLDFNYIQYDDWLYDGKYILECADRDTGLIQTEFAGHGCYLMGMLLSYDGKPAVEIDLAGLNLIEEFLLTIATLEFSSANHYLDQVKEKIISQISSAPTLIFN